MERKAKTLIALLGCWLLASTAFSQSAELIDEFPRVECGDFMARMDGIYNRLKDSPNLRVYVVYYGGRVRRFQHYDSKGKANPRLEYPHKNDSLNLAKAIPLYLSTLRAYPKEFRRRSRSDVILMNGGYMENVEFQIWLAPKDAPPPTPTPTVDEKEIRFRKHKPFKTPNYTGCYDNY